MATPADTIEKDEATVAFPVSGMTCAACQARVQRALKAQPGVVDATVNLLTGSAAVRYDPAAVTAENLVEAVRSTGYDAELPAIPPATLDRASDEDADGIRARVLATKAVVSVVAGLLMMALSMPMATNPFASYALLGVTSAILAWAGGEIYRRAWMAARHGSADMNTLVALGTGSAYFYSLVATVAPEIFARNGIPADVYY